MRKAYTRLGKREGKTHRSSIWRRRQPERGRAARDLFARHAVHRRFRAGGHPRQGRHDPLYGAPGAAPRSGIAPAARGPQTRLAGREPADRPHRAAGRRRRAQCVTGRDRRHAGRSRSRHRAWQPMLERLTRVGRNGASTRRARCSGDQRSAGLPRAGSPSTISPSSACASTRSRAKARTPNSWPSMARAWQCSTSPNSASCVRARNSSRRHRAASELHHRARAAAGHQGQCARPRPSARLHGLHRHQAVTAMAAG